MIKTIVLSLGGSIIVPDKVNINYLKRFKSLIVRLSRRGYRFIIVTGGGDTARTYQQAAKKVASQTSAPDLDWIGIAATKLNAELVRSMFGRMAYASVLHNPTKKIRTAKKVLIGSGWKPGCSSDKDAVLLAKTFSAKRIINMSNIDYVYTADPNKDENAKSIKHMSWHELLQLTGPTWRPGAHVPFDPEASKVAKTINLEAIICNGTYLKNIENIVLNNSYKGTRIS